MFDIAHSYHLDGSNAMDEELNELHVMDDQTRVAMLLIGYDDGTPFTKYILSDHLGSSNVILETDGSVYNREEYYPFGETSFGAFGKKRYRYVGKEKDEESGLYYYGARYFQPWSCRFISVDPLAGKYAQLTPYNYAANDPIGDLDIDGMQTPSTDTSQSSATAPTNTENKSTPKHGDSRTINGCSETFDQAENNGKGAWVDANTKWHLTLQRAITALDKYEKYYNNLTAALIDLEQTQKKWEEAKNKLTSTKKSDTAQISEVDLINPSGGALRGQDAYGNGHFGASRDGGTRQHMGIDILTTVGQNLVSPITGKAVNYIGTTSGKPMIDIIPSNADLGIDKVRILYVNMPSGANAWNSYNVTAGQTLIGTAADLGTLGYPKGITPHIHVQVMVGGRWVDPTPYFFGR